MLSLYEHTHNLPSPTNGAGLLYLLAIATAAFFARGRAR